MAIPRLDGQHGQRTVVEFPCFRRAIGYRGHAEFAEFGTAPIM